MPRCIPRACARLVLFFLIAPAAVRAQSQNVAQEWETYLARVNDAVARSDAPALGALWTEDSEWYQNGTLLAPAGRAALIPMFERSMADGTIPTPFATETIDGVDLGDHVYLYGIYTYADGDARGRTGFSGLMRRTPDGLVAHRLTKDTLPPAVAQASDARGAREVVAAFGAAWNAHDMDALAATFAEDAHWVNIVGMWWRGKDAVVAAHAAYHETIFRDVPIALGEADVRGVAPGVAVAVVTEQVGAFSTPGGNPMPAAENRITFVLTNREGRWLIVSGQNTVVDPTAAAFDPVNR